MKVMFICTGNICRSAMAEYMLKRRAKVENKNIEVCSCGIYAENGDIPTYESMQVMKEYGIDISKHKATNIRNSNIKDMDVILCATNRHKDTVIYMYPELEEKVYTMKEYAGYDEYDLDISDPWGYGLNVYRNCAKEIEQCVDKYIEKM